MRYNVIKTPCAECPFLTKMVGFSNSRLMQLSEGAFPCHLHCKIDDEGDYVPKDGDTPACAGALIFREKMDKPTQIMRIAHRLGLYDPSLLDMDAPVREVAFDDGEASK